MRRAGIMGIVIEGGTVSAGDPILVALPDLPHLPLERV
jgi:MOSC domain-containing protein YiiM